MLSHCTIHEIRFLLAEFPKVFSIILENVYHHHHNRNLNGSQMLPSYTEIHLIDLSGKATHFITLHIYTGHFFFSQKLFGRD